MPLLSPEFNSSSIILQSSMQGGDKITLDLKSAYPKAKKDSMPSCDSLKLKLLAFYCWRFFEVEIKYII